MTAHSRLLLAAVAVASLLLAACGGSTSVSGFNSDPAPIAADLALALADTTDPEAVPVVERRFLEACVKGGGDSLPLELATVQRDGLLAVCGCSFSALVQSSFAAAEADLDTASQDELEAAAFERFSDLDETVLNDEDLPAEVSDLIRACIRAEAGI